MENQAKARPAELSTNGANADHQTKFRFDDPDRRGLYKAIFNRRDVRGQFTAQPIPDSVLSRVLYAAHHTKRIIATHHYPDRRTLTVHDLSPRIGTTTKVVS